MPKLSVYSPIQYPLASHPIEADGPESYCRNRNIAQLIQDTVSTIVHKRRE
jgi:hypothetical protein